MRHSRKAQMVPSEARVTHLALYETSSESAPPTASNVTITKSVDA